MAQRSGTNYDLSGVESLVVSCRHWATLHHCIPSGSTATAVDRLDARASFALK
ncbi:MAG: hypothetical protein WBG38_18260 [Nodosilinea sp.]